MLPRPVLPLAGAALLLTLSACGGGSSSESATDSGTSASPSGSGTSGPNSDVTCDYPEAPQAATRKVDPPPETPDVQGKVSVSMRTSIGMLDATLDADRAPCTVNSFVSLAEQGFFDHTPCHRLTTAETKIFVLQCGDPSGTGTGGPGYTIPGEVSGDETYGAGTLAMANTNEDPDTGGSQFFIVYRSTPLPPRYTVFGQLDAAGVKAVRKVAKQGTDNAYGPGDGHPKVAVTLDTVTTG